MRPSFWKAQMSCFSLVIACVLALSFPRTSYAGASPGKTKLEIGSFNIQVFGESKVSKPFIRTTILSIISRYDIIFIQEIRDDKNKAIYDLLNELKSSTGRNYHALVSQRLGRGEMKEQYAYFYDADLVNAETSYVYPDNLDEFAREPFIARFSGVGLNFTLAGIHVAPTAVREELKAMNKVRAETIKRFGDDSLFLMGDFNADCIYYKPKEGFEYFDVSPALLIGDDEDTTVSPVSCAYDRILGFGKIVEHASQGRAFNFMDDLSLDLANAKLVSDHFPIEFTLSGDRVSTHEPLPPLEELKPKPSQPDNLSSATCGDVPYLTPTGRCYGSFPGGKVRVPAACCTF